MLRLRPLGHLSSGFQALVNVAGLSSRPIHDTKKQNPSPLATKEMTYLCEHKAITPLETETQEQDTLYGLGFRGSFSL
ncbi:hypothetical protein [Prochlorococcus sp. MIT 1201]|uniref:hypothetical protein n=1 Tax=Prochlorococcus sp. MIT 1201 TaxID=3082535 RepID=UPI0039A77E6C